VQFPFAPFQSDLSEREFCPKERKDIFDVQTGKRGSIRIYGRAVEERVY